MEIEQLKLILETLQGVGHEAGNLAVLYLWLQFIGGVLTNLSVLGIFLGLFYFIYRAIRTIQGNEEADAFFCSMRNQLFANTGGYLTDEERQRTITALRQLVAKHKEKA
jgi:hypothetical protein